LRTRDGQLERELARVRLPAEPPLRELELLLRRDELPLERLELPLLLLWLREDPLLRLDPPLPLDPLLRLDPLPREDVRPPLLRDELPLLRDELPLLRDELPLLRDELPLLREDVLRDRLLDPLELDRLRLVLRRERVFVRSSRGISARTTSLTRRPSSESRNFAIRSSSRRMLRASWAVSRSPTSVASVSIRL
jgi:hypothetical protein